MHYRKADKKDAPTLKDIARRVVVTNYAPFLGEEMAKEFIASGASDAEIDDGLDNTIILEVGGQIVGFSLIKEDLLHLLMVDVPAQRHGYGQQLLQYAEGLLCQANSRIRLQTFKENTAAVTFYMKSGWRIVSEHWVPELGMVMLHMDKSY